MNFEIIDVFVALWITFQSAAVIYLLSRAPAKPAHPCDISCDLTLIERQDYRTEIGGHFTLVLKTCKGCSDHDVTVLPGNWSLADLTRTESPIRELERMAR